MRFPTLSTQRLTIRPFALDDWPAVFGYTANPMVMTYIPEGPYKRDQAVAFVEKHSGDDAEAVAVVLAAEQRLIGHIVFHPWFAPRTYEIGWIFDPAYYRRGYASEAAAAILDYGFATLILHRVIATCQPENPASYRVMERIGMRREGLFRQCIYRNNDLWWDELFYAILREEWATRQGSAFHTGHR